MSFEFRIEDVFSISGRGTVVAGRALSGSLTVGQAVLVPLKDGTDLRTVVTGIEMFRRVTDRLEAGQQAGLLLRGVDKSSVARGGILRGVDTAPRPGDPDSPRDPEPTPKLHDIRLALPHVDAPLMLLPLRLETLATEMALRVRAFPDALHGDAPREGFSPDEIAAGNRWRNTSGTAARKALKAEIAAEFGGARGYALRKAAQAGQLQPGSPDSRRPLARDLPEQLIFHVRFDGADPITVAGAPVLQELPTGPGAGDTALMDTPGDPLFWLADFDRAVAVGMAVEIPFPDGKPPADVAELTVMGVRDGDAAALFERLAEGPGLGALHPGQDTKGSAAGQGGPLQNLPAGPPEALAALIGTRLPDTLEEARNTDRVAHAVMILLWEATLRPGFVSDQVFGDDLGFGRSGRALRDLLTGLQDVVPAPGALPVLQVGRSPIGLMCISIEPAPAAAAWLGQITEAIRGGLDPLGRAAAGMRPAPDAGAEGLVATLARMPFGRAWRARVRWYGPSVTPMILGAVQPPVTAGVQGDLESLSNSLKSAQRKAEKFGFARPGGPALFAEYLGAPFADVICGPLVAEGAEDRVTEDWKDPVIARLLEDPEVTQDLLRRQINRRDAEGPEPLLRVLCEDALRHVLADVSALAQTDGDPDAAAELRQSPPREADVHLPGDGTAHQLMVQLIEEQGIAVRDLPRARALTRFDRTRDLSQLVDAVDLLRKTPMSAVHLVLVTLLDTFSTRADVWIEAETRMALRKRPVRIPLGLGAWGHVEAVPLVAAAADQATYLAAPSQRLGRLAGLLDRAQAGLEAEGLAGAIDADLSAPRVQAARRLLADLAAAGRFDAALARSIAAGLREAGFADVIARMSQALPDPEGAPRFDALALLERGAGAVPGLTQAARRALEAALEATRAAGDVLGALMLADGGLALSEGRVERAAALLASRGAGGVPPLEPEAMQPRASGVALHFGVAVTGRGEGSFDSAPEAIAPVQADMAARLVGPLAGEITLHANAEQRPSRGVTLASLPGGALTLVRLAAPDRATLDAVGEVMALSAGLDPEDWRAQADAAAQDTLWAAGRAARILTEARSLTPEDFDDPGGAPLPHPQTDAAALQARIAAARAGLQSLADRVGDLIPRIAIPAQPILTRPTGPGVTFPVPELPVPGPVPLDIEIPGADPTPALLADLVACGILRSTRGRERAALLIRADQALTARLAAAEAAQTPQATLAVLLDDLPATIPLRLPRRDRAGIWSVPRGAAQLPPQATLSDWLETSQRVRPRLGPLADLMLGAAGMWAVQWPGPVVAEQSDWIGGARANDDYHGHASMVCCGPQPAPGGVIEGLLLDQWQEVVPDRSVTASLAVNASAPSSRAPQVALVAAAPQAGWDAGALLRVIDTAVGLARVRALTLTDLPDLQEGGTLYGDLGAVLPVLATAGETGLWRALCDPEPEVRL